MAIGKLNKKQINIVNTDPITELATPADSGSLESPDVKYVEFQIFLTFLSSINLS